MTCHEARRERGRSLRRQVVADLAGLAMGLLSLALFLLAAWLYVISQ